jgi:WD40 repeat protein
MSKPAAARIFISYSRKDGAALAAQLRRDLEAKGFVIWQDLVALEGGRDWWSQIEGALKSKALQHFILVVTPQALASPVVRREIRLARQEGKTFLPIKGPGLGDLNALPRWIGQLTDLDIAEHWLTLQRILEDEARVKRVPMMAPEPPADFVPRPVEFEGLKRRLLDAKGDAVGITAALRGAGGYGKTTLARALAHDPDIQDAYFDGVLWVELGEQGGQRVVTVINNLVALLTGASPQVTTLEAARTALAEALGDLRILLVIDDVWSRSHLDPFLFGAGHGGRHTTRLVTTRFDKELPETAVRQPVDAMQAGEALALLAYGLPDDQAEACAGELAALARRLHEWAQLLKLANGFLRDRVVKFRQPLATAIAEAGQRLAARGLPAFDDPHAKDYEGRHKSVAAAIGLNLDLLDADRRARFGELGIFPEDVDVPVGIVARLWHATGGLDAFATVDLLSELFDLSLLLDLDLDRRTLRFHDTTRQFLQDEARKAGQLAAQHARLVAALAGIVAAKDAEAAETDYFYRYLPEHLHEAGDRVGLDARLLDPGWLQVKLTATASPLALVADYEKFGQGQMQSLIGRTLRLTSGICARDPRQLMPQLLGRLMTAVDPAAPAFLAAARLHVVRPALLAQHPSLTPPGAETARLESHGGWVQALAVLPDGRLASGGEDGTIRLWDPARGTETARLMGVGSVRALAVLPDGRLASAGEDGTVRLWDLARAAETARIEGHGGVVRALAVLPDGELAIMRADGTIRLWNPRRGVETARLEGHGGLTRALAVLADGRLASGGDDGIIRLWDPARDAETARLEGHGGSARALAVLPDGRLASGGDDGIIRLWDPARGAESARLEGHDGSVRALAVLPDGRLASIGADGTIRLWDTARSVETARLEGHGGWALALAMLPDGRLASAGDDGIIRLWDPALGAKTAHLEGHGGWALALAMLPDGRLASGGDDGIIRLWDSTRGAETARLVGLGGPVRALAVMHDGRLASGGADGTIRLWDPARGAETARLEGQRGWVRALAVMHDGLLAPGGDDGIIRLWDPARGAEIAHLEGHRGWVRALVVIHDGRLASGGDDSIIRLWDPTRGAETARLEGRGGSVRALAVLPGGRLASGGDDGIIRLWDPARGAETKHVEGHRGWVRALAVLPDGRLASGGTDGTIRLWDPVPETARLEVDGAVICLATLADGRFVAGDALGRLHWLEVVE